MGTYDPTLVHVQLALLAFGFLLGFVSLLRDRVPLALVGASALAVLSAEPVLKQLSTGLADVPLAFFVALGLLGTGRWLASGERWALVAGTLFLGAATLTKSEGLFFALAALLALAPFAWGRRRELGVAAGAVVAIVLPWRLFVSLRDLPIVEYRFRDAVSPAYLSDHADRVGPAVRGLGGELLSGDWGLLVPLFLVAVVAAVLAGRYALAGFAVAVDRARVRRARARLLDLDDPGRAGARLVGRPHDRHRGRSARPRSPRSSRALPGLAAGEQAKNVERRLLLAGAGQQPGLPAAEPRLVAQQEPEHHVDPRVLAGDRVGLLHVRRLLGVRDAEGAVRRVRLVAVLGDPEPLVAPEQRQLVRSAC